MNDSVSSPSFNRLNRNNGSSSGRSFFSSLMGSITSTATTSLATTPTTPRFKADNNNNSPRLLIQRHTANDSNVLLPTSSPLIHRNTSSSSAHPNRQRQSLTNKRGSSFDKWQKLNHFVICIALLFFIILSWYQTMKWYQDNLLTPIIASSHDTNNNSNKKQQKLDVNPNDISPMTETTSIETGNDADATDDAAAGDDATATDDQGLDTNNNESNDTADNSNNEEDDEQNNNNSNEEGDEQNNTKEDEDDEQNNSNNAEEDDDKKVNTEEDGNSSDKSQELLFEDIIANKREQQLEQQQCSDPEEECVIDFVHNNMALCYFLPYGKNFGDELGPAVTKQLLNHYFDTATTTASNRKTTTTTNDCRLKDSVVLNLKQDKRKKAMKCLFTLGSILHMVREGDHIWGTGANPTYLMDKNKTISAGIHVHSTRGPHTYHLIQSQQPKTTILIHNTSSTESYYYGDPGFLTPFVYPQYQLSEDQQFGDEDNSIKKKYCLIPHFHDVKLPEIIAFNNDDPDVVIISPHDTWENVVFMIQTNCDYVASSSLHGLIIADAIGIPSQWIQLKNSKTSLTEGHFKYIDYYDSIGRPDMKPIEDLTRIKDLDSYTIPFTMEEKLDYSKTMIDSFPFDLFETKCIVKNNQPKNLQQHFELLNDNNANDNNIISTKDVEEDARLEGSSSLTDEQSGISNNRIIVAPEESTRDEDTDNTEKLVLAKSSSPVCTKSNEKCSINFREAKTMALCYFLPYGKNFGDELGPAMSKQLLINHFPTGCSIDNVVVINLKDPIQRKLRRVRRCVFTLGSILHMVRPGDHIWGTGGNPTYLQQNNRTIYPRIYVHATRGPRTWELFQQQQPDDTFGIDGVPMYGDPGFLTPTLYPQYKRKIRTGDDNEQRFCLVPHFHDLTLPDVKKFIIDHPDVVMISPQNTWENVVNRLSSECDYVASSSLHGLIVSDAMRIPTQWIQLPDSKTASTEGWFKYLDYYESVGKFGMEPVINLNHIKNITAYMEPLPIQTVSNYTNTMIQSFPYSLFESKCI